MILKREILGLKYPVSHGHKDCRNFFSVRIQLISNDLTFVGEISFEFYSYSIQADDDEMRSFKLMKRLFLSRNFVKASLEILQEFFLKMPFL